MTALRIGLVAEGHTDLVVIEVLLTEYYKRFRNDVALTFRNLQPSPDRTSGHSEGGWELVYKWCLSNPPDERRTQFLGQGLFANDMDGLSCDIIIVHMDADICEKVGDKSTVAPAPTPMSPPEERGAFIRKTILEWLWPDGEEPDGRHIPAPAVEATETWLVAGLTQEPHPEAIKNILHHLLFADSALRKVAVPKEGKKIRKSPRNYRRVARASACNITEIIERCPHFLTLVDTLSSIEIS